MKDIIRVGDRVRIIDPMVVVRVGYPKTVEDYLPAATADFGALLAAKKISAGPTRKILREIAYGLAKADGFGGRERTVHLRNEPGVLGKEFVVRSIRTAHTGTYYPPRYSRSLYDDDFEPGGLSGEKRHRIVAGFPNGWEPLDFTLRQKLLIADRPFEFLTTNLEKVKKASDD